MNSNCGDSAVFCTSGPHALSSQQRACHTVQELHLCTDHLDGPVTVQIQLPLLTATLVLQLEPGIIVVVWANIVIAAEPEIQHAYTPNELLVLEIIEEEFSSHRHNAVPNRIVRTIRSEKPPPHDIATQTPPQQGTDEEHEVTTVAVAAMVQPFKGTVNLWNSTGFGTDCTKGESLYNNGHEHNLVPELHLCKLHRILYCLDHGVQERACEPGKRTQRKVHCHKQYQPCKCHCNGLSGPYRPGCAASWAT